LGYEDFVDVDGAAGNLLAQASDLSDLLEIEDLAWLVAIDTESSRIVPSVLLARQSSAEDLEDLLAALQLRSARAQLSQMVQRRVNDS
jgi:hypothetical protein